MMKAIVCTKYGAPDVLQLKEIEKPVPKNNEVLIRVRATSVTAGDCRIRAFNVPPSYWLPGRLALGITKPRNNILGMEVAGDIESTGKNVKNFKPGDQVCAATGHDFGGYAEYLILSEKDVIVKKPAGLSYEEAASINIGGRTAIYFLKKGKISKGKKVLIYGASGSVGTFTIQLAKYYGAEVTAVCSGPNTALVTSLGADKVIDYTKEDFTKNGEKYDIIFDIVGKTSISKSIKSLTDDGAYMHAIATPGVSIQMGLLSIGNKKKFVGGTPSETTDDLAFLLKLAEEGKIKSVIDKKYPFDQLAEAHKYVDTGRKKGNVVITL